MSSPEKASPDEDWKLNQEEEQGDAFSSQAELGSTILTSTDADLSAKDVIELLGESTRPPPTGTEQLLANELAISMMSIPLEKIRHICEAAMVINEEDLGEYELEEDIKQILKIHALAVSFIRHYETIEWDMYNNEMPMVKVALPFSEGEAQYFLDPWTRDLSYESYIIQGSTASDSIYRAKIRFLELIRKEKLAGLTLPEIYKLKSIFIFWLLRDGFKVESYRMVETAFITWAMPQAAKWLNTIMGKINPESFKEALRTLTGKVSPT